MNLWEGRFSSALNADADAFNESLSFDRQLYKADITASVAHATMLGACKIIPEEEAEQIVAGLKTILADIESGALRIEGAEDIHSFVEYELVRRIGDAGKKLHTARSRNDQVATDLRLYVRASIDRNIVLLKDLVDALLYFSRTEKGVMPGFTHLRKAQPLRIGQYFNAYGEMFLRDIERFEDCRKRVNVMPLGSAALAGTSYPIDRDLTAKLLGFSAVSQNSVDAVSDRDFAAEYLFCASLVMTHLSRLAEDTILYTSEEFGYWEIPDEYSTGSSIMPQKKNPDLPELVRGKTGRVYGDLMGILTVLKGIPLAYDKDLQEDKEGIFDAERTVQSCLAIYTALLKKLTLHAETMRKAAGDGFSTATDVADYLAKKGVPFRDAHAATGKLVRYCIEKGKALTDLTLKEFLAVHPAFEEDVLAAVATERSAEARASVGGSSKAAVKAGTASLRKRLKTH